MRSPVIRFSQAVRRYIAVFALALPALLQAAVLEEGMTQDQVWSVLGDARFALKRGDRTFLTYDNGVKVVLTDGRVSGAEGIEVKEPPPPAPQVDEEDEEAYEDLAKNLTQALRPGDAGAASTGGEAPTGNDSEAGAKESEAASEETPPQAPTPANTEETQSNPIPPVPQADVTSVGEAAKDRMRLYYGIGGGVAVLALVLIVVARPRKSKESTVHREGFDEEDASTTGEAGKEVAVFDDPNELPEGMSEEDLPISLRIKKDAERRKQELEKTSKELAEERAASRRPLESEKPIPEFPPPKIEKKDQVAKPAEPPKAASKPAALAPKQKKQETPRKGKPSPKDLLADALRESEASATNAEADPLRDDDELEGALLEKPETEAKAEASDETEATIDDAVEMQDAGDDLDAFEAALDAYLSSDANSAEATDAETAGDLEDAAQGSEEGISEDTAEPDLNASSSDLETEEKPQISLRKTGSNADTEIDQSFERIEASVTETKKAAEEASEGSREPEKPRLRLTSK